MTSVLIRTDASRQIGLGHLARCLSLAESLRDAGARTTFVLRALDPDVPARISSRGFECRVLDPAIAPGSTEDADATRKIVGDLGPDVIVVVDHYAVDAHWERLIRPHVRKLAVIDDLANRSHDCDVLIDQNRPFGAGAYEGLVPPDCVMLVGPKYALLRPEFAEQRAIPRPRDGTVRRMFVSFGGSDPAGHTQAILRALARFRDQIEKIDIVIGPLNAARAEIETLTWSPQVTVHVDPPNMAELMRVADLAIGAGGVSSWERLCLSLPALAVGIVDNQAQNIRDLLRMGVAAGVPDMLVPDEPVLADWLACLLSAPDLVAGMAARAGAIVDGQGSRRAAARLAAGAVSFRKARADDCQMIHEWRNHPTVRAVSLNNAEIPFEAHRAWFIPAIADPGRILLVAEREGIPAGVARFDLDGAAAEISVYRKPGFAGPVDLVAGATRWLFDNRPDILTIDAVVLSANEPSRRAFESAGYRLDESRYVASREHTAG